MNGHLKLLPGTASSNTEEEPDFRTSIYNYINYIRGLPVKRAVNRYFKLMKDYMYGLQVLKG